MQSRELAACVAIVALDLRSLTDHAVLARTEARRLRARASRIDELKRPTEAFKWPLSTSGVAENLGIDSTFTDGEILEDEVLLTSLNELGYRCDKCKGEEPLVAVVRFEDFSAALGICGDCYRELGGLALGQVI